MNYKEWKKDVDKKTTPKWLKDQIIKLHHTDPKLAKYMYTRYKKKGGKLTYTQIVGK